MGGEALKMAKSKLGLNNPGADGGSRDKPKDQIAQELEDEIAQETDFEKRQALRLQLRELRLQREIRVKDLEDKLRGAREGGKPVEENESEKQEREEHEKRALQDRQKLMGQAKSLIDSGMSPQQVGQMLMGLPVLPTTVGGQGLSVADALKLVDTIIDKRSESELRTLIAKLDQKIDRIAAGGGAGGKEPPPVTHIVVNADGSITEVKAGQPIIIRPQPAGGEGKTVEQMREEHRHEEEMAKVDVDKNYKEKIVGVAGDAMELIGRGAAHQLLEEGGAEESSGGEEAEYMTCPVAKGGCGASIFMPPGATQVTCPKCKTIWGPPEK